MHRTPLAALIAGFITPFAPPVAAEEPPLLDEIVVTATRVPTPDARAPYASEVHTRRQIEQSGSSTLYDYLAQHSSVNVMPNYGNRFTPQLDMRGYGSGGGQSLVVTLDGQRLNNIDGLPQLLGAIPLDDIERIEITKGGGAVMQGDGALAGSIQIITRGHEGVKLLAGAGNFGAFMASASAGVKGERASLSASTTYDRNDGHADADVTGQKDAANNRVWRGTLDLRLTDRLSLGVDAASTRIDTRYTGALTQAEFNSRPAQNSGNTYNHQKLASDTQRVRAGLELGHGWRVSLAHGEEDKLSHYVSPFAARYDYDYASDDIAAQYLGAAFDLTAGWQRFDGVRVSRNGFGDNDTHKNNRGYYAQGQYRAGASTLSAGARRENVAYRYLPVGGNAIAAEHNLSAWNLGLNQRLTERASLFVSLERAFQAPNIDSFFTDTNLDFIPDAVNLNIRPARNRTLSTGITFAAARHRLKATTFYSTLRDEIYFNPVTFANTNLDKTHKYGLELQDDWRTSDTLEVKLNYTWTRAVIDQENDGAGAFNGKDLPGAPRHGLSVALNWQPRAGWQASLAHTWKSDAYAANDFANTFTQKQAGYQSTDLTLSYRARQWEWFLGVENLFEHANGLWIQDDVIYPVNFTRNWRTGLKARF